MLRSSSGLGVRATLFTAAAVFGAGCFAPEPVVRLEAMGSSLVWSGGEAVAARQSDGVRAAVAFSGQREGMLGIRVEIANDDADPFTFDPAKARYLARAEGAAAWTPVVDPEQLLLAFDLAKSREIADANNAAATGAVISLLTITAAVAAAGSGDHRSARHLADTAAVTSAVSQSSAADHANRANAAAATRQSLAAEVFRRTTLPRGAVASGTIYLPTVPGATEVWLRLVAGPAIFDFPFHQRTYDPVTGTVATQHASRVSSHPDPGPAAGGARGGLALGGRDGATLPARLRVGSGDGRVPD
jgi:hypothetical protein